MTCATETALVFADLRDAFATLDAARGSPKEVRRTFSRYIELSQKFTSAMRKDASRLEKGEWVASAFPGWTPATELIKYLRNEDQHGDQVFLSVHERRHFLIPTTLLPGFNVESDRTFVSEGTWVLSDQLTDAPPEGITAYEFDPITRQPTNREMVPLKIERLYILQARSEKAKKKITAAGAVDVHELAEATFSTFTSYFEFFCEQCDTESPRVFRR